MLRMSNYIFSPEQFAQVGDVSICYQTIGDPTAAPLLLVAGLSMQMIGWHADFCLQLAELGFFVIRMDNRDVGLSTRFDEESMPSSSQIIGGMLFGRTIPQFYTLSDMAADAVGVLDHLGIEQAHILGASMGGMISQVAVIDHPTRFLSLTSVMSTTNERDLPKATAKASAFLMRPLATDLKSHIKNSVAINRFLYGSRYPFDEARAQQEAELSWHRAQPDEGAQRQLGAIANTPGRRAALHAVTIPALVIHGDDDPLVRYQCGIDTAEALPNARLMLMPGMSHSLPPETWPEIFDALLLLTQATDRPVATQATETP